MAVRTTATKVKALLDNSTLTDAQVDEFIISANLFVTNHLGGEGLANDTLTDIERWIAAHMISVTRERQAKKEEAGSAKVEYAGDWGSGLNMTSYGQMAVKLDTTGTLEDLADGKKPINLIAL